MESAIKHFASCDVLKAPLLLGTLPKIQLYQSITDSITTGTAAPAYAATVLRLKELNDRPVVRRTKKGDRQEPPAAFATEEQRA